ncbi:hypothetical protein CRG98_022614 [Punica granatum]|uniref:Uncharacterized protein n=1 Tax=Punica granatum TaxID=22663 RepID=A0A2I0JL42_PUNGR|nr:hypothetical protein CRG98_022614 [Punica granatum]
MTPTTASYQRNACHGFLLLIFGTLLFPYSPNLIDGAIAQVVLQAVGGHSYVEALLAETVRSLDYVRERTEPGLFELHTPTGTGANSRSNPVGSTNPSPGECRGSRTANAVYVHDSPLYQSTPAATGPFGSPSSAGYLPILGAHLVRASTNFHTGSGYDLCGTSTDGFPGTHRTCSDAPSSH